MVHSAVLRRVALRRFRRALSTGGHNGRSQIMTHVGCNYSCRGRSSVGPLLFSGGCGVWMRPQRSPPAMSHLTSRRSLSTSTPGDAGTSDAAAAPGAVPPGSLPGAGEVAAPVGDLATPAAELAAAAPPELGYWPPDVAMWVVDSAASLAGVPYWVAIVGTTTALRLAMLPVGIRTLRNTARMAHARPEMEALQKRVQGDPGRAQMGLSERTRQDRYRQEINALFDKHNVKPLRSLAFPVLQLPVFISFFLALRRMGEQFPAYATGGALWFPDLGAPDPTLALPLITSASFLLMAEMGADGMVQGTTSAGFRAMMRAVAVLMVPLTAQMSSGVFMYWLATNVFSLGQTLVLKHPRIKKALAIPKTADLQPSGPPDGIVGVLGAKNPIAAYRSLVEARRDAHMHPVSREILHGPAATGSAQEATPPPPPGRTTPRVAMFTTTPSKRGGGAASAAAGKGKREKERG